MSEKPLPRRDHDVLGANILIRGVLGARVRELIEQYGEETSFFAPDLVFNEASQNLPIIARKRRVDPAPLLDSLDRLRLVVEATAADVIAPLESAAMARIGVRDLDDWPIVAPALTLDCPIWTQDRDFFGVGVATWTSDLVEIYLRGDDDGLTDTRQTMGTVRGVMPHATARVMASSPGELVRRLRALDPAERVTAAVHLLDILEEIDGLWSDTRDPGDPPDVATRRLTYGEILDAGAALPLTSRADLVWELVRTLDEDWIEQNRAPIDPQWCNEITRRLDDILLGQVSQIDKPESLRLIRALLYRRTTGEAVRSIAPAIDEVDRG